MPTVTLNPTRDVHITNHSWSWNGWYINQSGTYSSLWLGSWGWSANQISGFYAYQSRILLKYDMPALPVGATIVSAKLRMWLMKTDDMKSWNAAYYSPNNNPTLTVHNLLQDWQEGTGDGHTDGRQWTGATWSYRGPNQGSWSTNGGYFNTTPAATVTGPWGGHQWEFDVKSLVDGWYAAPSSNFGMLIKYLNDSTPQGAMYTGSIEGNWAPVLEITYNTPPEKPRGLVPNFDSFVCYDLSHTTHFKWNFIDVTAPPDKGRANFVFLINVGNSMQWRLNYVRDEIGRFIDRLNTQQVDWEIGLVAFSDVTAKEPIRKWGWFTKKQDVTTAFDNMPRLSGPSWPKSGLDAIMDPTNGALSFAYREKTKVQFFVATDGPFHNKSGVDGYYINSSAYELNNVIQALKDRSIVIHLNTNTHCASYTQLHQMALQTSGQYIEETLGWASYLPIQVDTTFENESLKANEWDYQTRADLRVWKINSDAVGSRTLIWTYTVNGSAQELRTKGLGIPWEEGASYEWDVTCYDSFGAASPPSDKAQFTYIIDVNINVGIPMYLEPLTAGNTIDKKALLEFRGKLYDEVSKYRDLDPIDVLTLFTGEVVPSKSDMVKLRGLMNRILKDEGLPLLTEDLMNQPTMSIAVIEHIRAVLTQISYSPPDTPAGGKAVRSNGQVARPISIVATNTSSADTHIVVSWSRGEWKPAGWVVEMAPSKDTDINYYKFYHEQVINYLGAPTYMLTEVYMKAEQIMDGRIYVPDTGRVDSQRMWYHAHDMNGRVSQGNSPIAMDATGATGNRARNTWLYVVECQQRPWGTQHPDPNGTWFQVYYGAWWTSFTHTVGGEGSYFYRVKVIDNDGVSTDWTYTVDTTYVKF